MKSKALDKLGNFLMTRFRDRGIDHFDGLAGQHWQAHGLTSLQNDLATLTNEQRLIVRRAAIDTLDNAIHDLLFAIQENADFENDIQIAVDGVNVVNESDGLHGELFGTDGWKHRFSKHGEPPAEP